VYLQRNSDDKVLYDAVNTIARIMAEAIVKALSEKKPIAKEGSSPLINEKGEKLVFSISEAAKALGISDATVRSLTLTGKIRAVRIGRRILIPRKGLQELLEEVSTNR
jgi:excisionase family DNA binding protein